MAVNAVALQKGVENIMNGTSKQQGRFKENTYKKKIAEYF